MIQLHDCTFALPIADVISAYLRQHIITCILSDVITDYGCITLSFTGESLEDAGRFQDMPLYSHQTHLMCQCNVYSPKELQNSVAWSV